MRSQKYREDEDSGVNREQPKVKSNNVYFSDSAEAEQAVAEVDLKLSGPDSEKPTRQKSAKKREGTNRSLEKEFDIVAEKYPKELNKSSATHSSQEFRIRPAPQEHEG